MFSAVATLGPPLGKRTLFVAGILRRSPRPAAAAALIAFLSQSGETIRRHGLVAV